MANLKTTTKEKTSGAKTPSAKTSSVKTSTVKTSTAKTSTGKKRVAKPRGDAAPWDRENPKPKGHHTPLGPDAKAAAKRRAKAAGRPYPNLIDNMWAASQSKKG